MSPTDPISPVALPIAARRNVIVDFFGRWPGPGRTGLGLGRALAEFQEWEIASGRLDARSGSRWWASVNGGLVNDLHRAGSEPASVTDDPAVAAWRAYQTADAATAQATLWSAHQSSLDVAVPASRSLLEEETEAERAFAELALEGVERSARDLVATDDGLLGDLASQYYPDRYPITDEQLAVLRAGILT